MQTQAAQPTAPHVIEFCRRIRADSRPVLLPITPEADSAQLDCFHNVRKKVVQAGGKLVTGWAIWEWPGVYIEAEHHAVYEAGPGGPLADLTPAQVPSIRTRLFLPDPSATYDFENEGVRRDNHRHALGKDPLIKQLFQSASAVNELMNSIPGIGEIRVSPEVARTLQELQQENLMITYQLGMKYTPRNAPCFCGQGKKFKQCHGRGDV